MTSGARCSVVIPAYNVDRYVADAVRSALEQTYENREVIVVNDGSTDATAEAVRPYLEHVVYVEQPNRGPSAARNRGIERATGDVIALLDGDDTWLPTTLERLLSQLLEHPEFGVVTTSRGSLMLPAWRRFRRRNQLFWITQYNFVSYATVIRKELFERHGLFDEELRACVDWELWMRFLAGGERIGAVDQRLLVKRLREGAISFDWNQNLRNQRTMLEHVISKGYDLPGLRGRLRVARGRAAVADGDLKEARGQFLAALRDPSLAISTRTQVLPYLLVPRTVLRSRRWLLSVARRRPPGDPGA